jgi:DNA modification methylase
VSLYIGDCRAGLRQWAVEGVRAQCVVTSPPYWGLRDYGISGQLGLESTPEEYVTSLVEVFRLVCDVLADDGVLWLNLGDSYANDGKWGGKTGGKHAAALHGPSNGNGRGHRMTGLKPKDLVGIPWRVAFALQADGWWLRSDIIWSKPSPMPERVTDRPTKAHEYLFLLAKSEQYFYDAEAIAERALWPDGPNAPDAITSPYGQGFTRRARNGASRRSNWRNRRSVWTIPTAPYPDAHFATFPPDLVTPCILAGSRPADIVLDPFMGSGTVAMVAQDLGRRWLGCELNPAYAAMVEQRTRQQGLILS